MSFLCSRVTISIYAYLIEDYAPKKPFCEIFSCPDASNTRYKIEASKSQLSLTLSAVCILTTMLYSSPATRPEKYNPLLHPSPHMFFRQENDLAPYDGIYSSHTASIALRCVWDTMLFPALSEHCRACGTRRALHIESAMMVLRVTS